MASPPHDALARLRARIEGHLAAFPQQPPGGAPTRRAAVAITVSWEPDAGPVFLLTKRSPRIRTHRGQWALPGGRLDPGEGPEDAARRELREELGVALQPDSVLGRLDDYPTRSGFHITPVVVWAGPQVAVEPDPAEVALVVRVALDELDRDDSPRWLSRDGAAGPLIQMPIHDHLIHAPTGAILYQFREVALHGRATRVAHFDEVAFARR